MVATSAGIEFAFMAIVDEAYTYTIEVHIPVEFA